MHIVANIEEKYLSQISIGAKVNVSKPQLSPRPRICIWSWSQFPSPLVLINRDGEISKHLSGVIRFSLLGNGLGGLFHDAQILGHVSGPGDIVHCTFQIFIQTA